jgi:hypothetical protein
MTTKQAKAIKHIIEDGDSAGKAMLKAGYSPSMAKNPQRLTKSPLFLDTLEKVGISDEMLAKTLYDGLTATKAVVMGKESTESFVDVQPDTPSRLKALEIGLKLKGHTKEAEAPNTVINQILVKFINADH